MCYLKHRSVVLTVAENRSRMGTRKRIENTLLKTGNSRRYRGSSDRPLTTVKLRTLTFAVVRTVVEFTARSIA